MPVPSRQIVIQGDNGEISVYLEREDGVERGMITVDGVFYHIERMPQSQFTAKYRVDSDPSYSPKTDKNGLCVLIAPFCE